MLEDDYDAEYRYDRQPVGALQGLDPQRVVYMSSISKTLAPALRIGWLVAPPGAGGGDRAREGSPTTAARPCSRSSGSRSCSSAASSTATCAARGSSTAAGATRSSPRSRATCPSCARGARRPGCTCSSTCPTDVDEGALVRAAESRGVGLDSLAPALRPPRRPGVILGYGRIAEPAIEPGVRALAAAIEAVTPS